MPDNSLKTVIKLETFRKYGIRLVSVYFFCTFEGDSRIPIYEFVLSDGSFCIRIFAYDAELDVYFACAEMTEKYRILLELEV